MGCGGGGNSGCGGGSSHCDDDDDGREERKGPCNRDLLAVDNPNFSVVTKAGCNASCPFCFQNKVVKPSPKYMEILAKTLVHLPLEFQRCSITGGEPTLDFELPKMLDMLGERFQKIVLNTNGAKLPDLIGKKEFQDNVNHVNYSRHQVDQACNDAVMGVQTVSEYIMTNIFDRLSELGIDVTLTTVIDECTEKNSIEAYVDFARKVGASAACFRKLTTAKSDLKPVAAELAYKHHRVLQHDECPACRTDVRLIRGLPTVWKAGCMEPMEKLDLVYELIFQMDGRLTADWAGQQEIRVHKGYMITPKMMELINVKKQMRELEIRQRQLDEEQRRLKQQARLMKDPRALLKKL